MDARHAADPAELLEEHELVPVIQGSIPYIKELVDKCLDAGIPASTGCQSGKKQGCCVNVHLLVRQEDIGRVARLMQNDWLEMLAREGTAGAITVRAATAEALDAASDNSVDSEPPCPACGTAAPLTDGECAGCGLYLGG